MARQGFDEHDQKILELLQHDASLSLQQIADAVGLSTTPCWNRIQKLEERGVIRARVALLDPEKIGLSTIVFLFIKTDKHEESWLNDFSKAVSKQPEVMEFYRISGVYDYLIKVAVSDIAAYDRFYKRLIKAAEIYEVTSAFTMEAIKDSSAFPLNAMNL